MLYYIGTKILFNTIQRYFQVNKTSVKMLKIQKQCEYCQLCQKYKTWGDKKVLKANEEFFAFQDEDNSAQLHIRVCPIQHIPTPLQINDTQKLKRMENFARQVLQQNTQGKQKQQHRFGFHLRPYNSVQHTNLHGFVLPFSNADWSEKLYGQMLSSVNFVINYLLKYSDTCKYCEMFRKVNENGGNSDKILKFNNQFFAFQDLDTSATQHILVCPLEHFEKVSQLKNEKRLCRMKQFGLKALTQVNPEYEKKKLEFLFQKNSDIKHLHLDCFVEPNKDEKFQNLKSKNFYKFDHFMPEEKENIASQ